MTRVASLCTGVLVGVGTTVATLVLCDAETWTSTRQAASALLFFCGVALVFVVSLLAASQGDVGQWRAAALLRDVRHLLRGSVLACPACRSRPPLCRDCGRLGEPIQPSCGYCSGTRLVADPKAERALSAIEELRQ